MCSIFESTSELVKAQFIFLVFLAGCLWHFVMFSHDQQWLFEHMCAPYPEFSDVWAIAVMTE